MRTIFGEGSAAGWEAPRAAPLTGTFASLTGAMLGACATREDGEAWCFGAIRGPSGGATAAVPPFRMSRVHRFGRIDVGRASALAAPCGVATSGRALCTSRGEGW